MKTGLVLEGGALRTIYSCGVLDAFLDAGLPLPDYTVGVSAGAAYGASYLSRQNRRNLKLAMGYVDDPRYMGMRNLLDRDNRAYFGLKFVYETLPNELVPFDYDALEAYPGEFEAVVTSLETLPGRISCADAVFGDGKGGVLACPPAGPGERGLAGHLCHSPHVPAHRAGRTSLL